MELSTGNFKPELGVLKTSLQTLGHVGAKFQFQLLENLDEVLNLLKEKLSPEDYHRIETSMELMLKQPLRRTLGRVRNVVRSLEEIKRSFE